jgi:lysozyme family protein
MDSTTAFFILMKFEGGAALTNTKGDKGGLTKYGIAQASHPGVDIASLTQEQAIQLYIEEYWVPLHCANLKPGLQYMHFDTAVNCGVVAAVKMLQRAAKVTPDGIMGPETIVASMKISLPQYAIQRLAYYSEIVKNDNSQSKFYIGWVNRVRTIVERDY